MTLALIIMPISFSQAEDAKPQTTNAVYQSLANGVFDLNIFNNPQQQYILGTIYENGDGVIINEAIALMWYIISADNGFSPAKKKIRILNKLMAQDQILKSETLAKNWLLNISDKSS